MASRPNIVVIVVDRLGAGWLAPYGNTWIDAPALDRLASESTLCEFMVSDAVDLLTVYRSFFTGLPAWCTADSDAPALPELAREQGYRTLLVTDSEELAGSSWCQGFDDPALVAWSKPATTAQEVSQTRSADVLSAAADLVAESAAPMFLWVHLAGLNTAWDAPYPLRQRFAAEDDPEPPSGVEPPSRELPKGYDPDELLGMVHSYAAEVTALDSCLSTFLDSLAGRFDPAETLLVFTSPRGYALGEHGHVGTMGAALHGELLQVPLLVRFPQGFGRLCRLTSLHHPADVYATLASQLGSLLPEGWGADLRTSAAGGGREFPFVASHAVDEISLRTPHWFYRRREGDDEPIEQLYAKPDDRWEVNEVSARAKDIVAGCNEVLAWMLANRHLRTCPNLPELPEALRLARR